MSFRIKSLLQRGAFFSLVLFLLSFEGAGAVYELESTFLGSIRKLKLNIPDAIGEETVRAIFIIGNGAGGDSTASALNEEYGAFAEHYGLAILATGYWGNFSNANDLEIELLEGMIAELAVLSEHPELVHAPWLPTGHSNGGQMSCGINTKRPEKTIAFVTGSGGYYNDLEPPAVALLTPGMIICGADDRDYRITANRNLFENNRPRGALWAWTEQEGSGHEEAEMLHLKLAFLEECLRLRYPTNQTPILGPVEFKTLDEFDGWLVNQNTRKSGDLVEIAPHSAVVGNPYDLAWVPSEKIARLYQAYSTYGKVATHENIQTTDSPVPQGGVYSYQPTLNRTDWTKLEYYLDGQKVGEVLASDSAANPTLAVEVDEGGYHSVYGIVTLEDGRKRSTAIRSFFQIGPRRSSVFAKWLRRVQPSAIEIVDPMISENQFVDEQGYSSLLDDLQPLRISNFRIEQDALDNARYCFDVVCADSSSINGFLYRLSYHVDVDTSAAGGFQLELLRTFFSLQTLYLDSGPLLELEPLITFEGI